jgi:hypothetical protein
MSSNAHEPTVRVCTVFFSALIGFAMTRFFQQTHPLPDVDRWPCFTAALLLFLRYLFGSANHLWSELVGPSANKIAKRLHLFWDLFGLILAGVLAVYICDSHSVADFLWGCFWFSVFWAVSDAMSHWFWEGEFMWQWVVMNGIAVVVIGLLLALNSAGSPFYDQIRGSWIWGLAAFFVPLFFWDLHHQLKQVEK